LHVRIYTASIYLKLYSGRSANRRYEHLGSRQPTTA